MQNPIKNFRQSSAVFEKLYILSWNIEQVSDLPISTKGCSGFFVQILIRTWVICQNKKRPAFYTLTKTRFINNLRSEQKKPSQTLFCRLGKSKTCAKFQQKKLNSMVAGARQSFQFFRQISWFLENKRGLSEFKYWVLHHLISIIKLQNHQILTTRTTLNDLESRFGAF